MKRRTISIASAIICCVMGAANISARTHKSITWEKFKASGPELKQVGWLATRHSKDIASSDWSIGCETLDRDYARFSTYKDYVGELGAKHGRLQSGWAKCEKKKGVYEFAWLDESIHGLKEIGVDPWVCLCYGNPVYKSDVRLGSGLGPLVQSKEGYAAWLKYVEATVTRYKDVVTEWEIWNEPFGQAENYSVMLLDTAELIRNIQPKAVIIATAIHDKDRDVCLELLKKKGKLDLVNYWAYHPYTRNPDSSYVHVEKMQKQIEAYSPKYKLYQGEVGCPSILEWTHALSNYPWTEYSQPKWNLRRMAGDRVRGIRCNVFTMIDLRYYNMQQSFGMIRSNLKLDFIYKRPTFYAVQHMMTFFDDAVKPVGILECDSDSKRKITVAGFDKKGTSVSLLWFSDKIPDDEISWDKVDLTVKGVTYKDPVYVEMITGKVFELAKGAWMSAEGNTVLTQLPVWDSPMMLVERTQVELRK
ncbi:MAG: glycoside hydrolase [Kiritimatiellae bacterium]|jgi:hypothetical protein|nr:glycoside hydrolase [Kiritimatiellia bacterium]